MTKEQLKKDIVRLVCEEGQGLSLQEAAESIQEALPAFLGMARIVDGMLAPEKARRTA